MGFDLDNAWQREVRDRILAPHFYRKHAVEGRYIFVDKGQSYYCEADARLDERGVWGVMAQPLNRPEDGLPLPGERTP